MSSKLLGGVKSGLGMAVRQAGGGWQRCLMHGGEGERKVCVVKRRPRNGGQLAGGKEVGKGWTAERDVAVVKGG